MRFTPVFKALLVLGLAGCGSNGDDERTASSAVSGAGADTSASGNITSIPNNPLNLSPAPVFAASSRSVTYDDCFPQHDDIQIGDRQVDRIEQYDSGRNEISSYTTTTIVTGVAPHTYAGRQGVLISTENPVHDEGGTLISNIFSEELSLRGAQQTLSARQFNYAAGSTFHNHTITETPVELGDIALGHETLPYKPGDSTVSIYDTVTEGDVPGAGVKVRMTEKLTFLGVEEGTAVLGYTFPYTCVFRREYSSEFGSGVSDYYVHKLGGAKTVEYDERAPRPLVHQMVSDTAVLRRAK